MSDNKKYYYMRLKEDFFDSDEMIMLESLPSGHQYANILLKLYLKSLKHNGRLVFRENIPYSPEMLSTVLHVEIGILKEALSKLEQFGLIEVLDTGVIYMNDIQLFIGKTSTEGDRKKAQRMQIEEEKQQSLSTNKTDVGHLSAIRTPEIEIEKEIEKELETEQEKEQAATTLINKLSAALVRNRIKMDESKTQALSTELLNRGQGIEPDELYLMFVDCLQYAIANRKSRPVAYALTRLSENIKDGYTTLEKIQDKEAYRNAESIPVPPELPDVPLDVDVANVDWSKY